MFLFLHRPSSLRLLFFMALAACSIVVFSFLLYVTLNARARIEQSLAALSGQETKIQMQTRLASIARETAAERTELQNLILPKGGGAAAFITELERLGEVSKVDLEVTSVTATKPKATTPGQLTLSVHYAGSYNACMRFLKLVETAPAAISVNHLTMTYNSAARTWESTLTIRVLSFDTP